MSKDNASISIPWRGKAPRKGTYFTLNPKHNKTMALHNTTGQWGEKIAENLMVQKGYRIRERNWRWEHLEVDLIAENKESIVFVEVKTRTSLFGGKTPAQYVDDEKKAHIVRASNTYVRQEKIEKPIRYDVIGILLRPLSKEVVDIVHYENAFYPSQRTYGGYGGERKGTYKSAREEGKQWAKRRRW